MLGAAQSTMRQNYINGGPGVSISGLAWLSAAIVTHLVGFQWGMLTLFIGGMLIVPISGVIENTMKGDVSAPDKGLTRLALLTLPLLFGGLFLGYVLSFQSEALFFETVAVAIGLRYLVFSHVYGLKTFVVLGAMLAATGITAYLIPIELALTPAVVGIVELLIGVFLILQDRN
ncbi:MAG: hypothetical protein AAFQ22_14100 [Pseudomonadota bacterium]